MNIGEAKYWKDYISRTINSILGGMSSTEVDAAEISSFEDRHMQTITGQQMLPQSTFRTFLRLFSKIPAQQEMLDDKIAWIEENLPFEECSEADIDAIFEGDMLSLSSLTEVDDDGYIPVEHIPIDEDGYIPIAENAIDEDGYIVESN